MIKTKRPRSGHGLLIKKKRKKSHFVLLVGVLCHRHGPEFHGDPERSPEEERRREWGAYLRQRGEERVGLISLLGKPPLYPGFPAAGWEEGCLVSSRATQMCRSRESAALWSYGNKTKSESAKVSDRGRGVGFAVRTTGHQKAKGKYS